MHLLSKIHVAGAMYKVFLPKIPNINTHNPGLFTCHNKRICDLS